MQEMSEVQSVAKFEESTAKPRGKRPRGKRTSLGSDFEFPKKNLRRVNHNSPCVNCGGNSVDPKTWLVGGKCIYYK